MTCGTTTGYRHGCRCAQCRDAHRLSALNLRRRRGIGPRQPRPVMDRFWEKVDQTESCWLWTGSLDGCGYGMFKVGDRGVRPHRWLYEQLHGEIAEGLQLDHLCRVRNCVNPAHLEPVTPAENSRRARKTHCIHGHELTDDNVYWTRTCRKCAQARSRGEI